MRFRIKGRVLRAVKSSIDYALWMLVDSQPQEFDHKVKAEAYLLTYVDDFLMVGPQYVRNVIEEEISAIWKARVEGQVNQFDKANPDASITFLSTLIRPHPKYGGFTMCQEAFIRDMLKTWEITDCRSLSVPGEVSSVELPEESNPKAEDIHRAQKLAGSLIWLSTRTRPDIVYSQSRKMI